MRLRARTVAQIGAILTIFAAGSTAMQLLALHISHEFLGVSQYQLPLAREIDDVIRATESYKADLLFLVGGFTPEGGDPSELRAALDRHAARARTHIRALGALLDAAVADERNPMDERVRLARARGALDASVEEIDAYVDTGVRALEAFDRGDQQALGKRTAVLLAADAKLDRDLGASRRELIALAERGSDEIRGHLRELVTFGRVVFAIAASLGLWFGFVSARRLANRLSRLHEAVDTAVAGAAPVPFPPAAADEIGDLGRSFEALVGTLHEERSLAHRFGRFLDPRIAAHIACGASTEDQSPERRPATILFADIAGFSLVAEKLTAEVLVRLLNRVFQEAAQSIRLHGGVVDKYIGDAIMAFFAQPFCAAEAHGAGACLAAIEHCATLERIAPELADLMGLRRGAPPVLMRVGIATGDVVMGTVGAPEARSFTVIGDPVNAASRLTGVNKVYGTRVLVCEETWRISAEAVEAREIDRVLVSGKSEPVTLYEVLGACGSVAPATLEVAETYAKALHRYRALDFAEAERGFAECLRLAPEDRASRVLRERSALFLKEPPPEDWDAVWHLSSK